MKGLIICTLHLKLFQVNELNNIKIISHIIRDNEYDTNFRRNPFGADAIINTLSNGVLSIQILPRRYLLSKCQIVSRNTKEM